MRCPPSPSCAPTWEYPAPPSTRGPFRTLVALDTSSVRHGHGMFVGPGLHAPHGQVPHLQGLLSGTLTTDYETSSKYASPLDNSPSPRLLQLPAGSTPRRQHQAPRLTRQTLHRPGRRFPPRLLEPLTATSTSTSPEAFWAISHPHRPPPGCPKLERPHQHRQGPTGPCQAAHAGRHPRLPSHHRPLRLLARLHTP